MPQRNQSRQKNKSFVNSNIGIDTEERNACYKAYRNRLQHILRTAERQYYQDLLIQHEANIKKIMARDQVNHQ